MLIELKDVNKTYQGAQPLHVLKGIDLTIEKGEFVSIMGASGSGKSTLLNILGILDNYDSGEYRINGSLIWNLSETKAAEYRNKMIGFIFQSYNLIGFKTAAENVELPLFYQGVGRQKRHRMAMEFLERLGLKEWADHYPNEMSGGQKQRVAIARALITKTGDHPCRRAHRSLGLKDFRGDHEPAAGTQREGEHDHHRRDPRERGGQLHQQNHPHQGRNHRQNRAEHQTRCVSVRRGHYNEVSDERPV